MKNKILISCLTLVLVMAVPFPTIQASSLKNKIGSVFKKAAGLQKPSNDEVIAGLREALSIGSKNSASKASKLDGFYKNPEIFIPFPPEAKKVKSVAEKIGLRREVDDFVMTLNRAAEDASKKAAPIFLNAIRQLTIKDGFQILEGPNDAATRYLKSKTSSQLTTAFNPIVKQAVDKAQVTKHWNKVATVYNSTPLVTKINPDLDAYVTERAVAGLFVLVAQEEGKIRKDPAARVTEILRKVFGYKN